MAGRQTGYRTAVPPQRSPVGFSCGHSPAAAIPNTREPLIRLTTHSGVLAMLQTWAHTVRALIETGLFSFFSL